VNTDPQAGHLSEPDIWPFCNQLEDLLDAVNFHLLRYLQERAEGNQGDAAQHFNIGHNMLGAAQTVAAALAVKVRVRNELSRGEP